MKTLLCGSIALDRIMMFDGRFAEVIQPDKLHVLSLSVLLDDLQETRGGVAANIAYTLALLGEEPILYGSVGTNARDYMEALGGLGIDVSHVHYSKKPTATFSVITDKADCQVGGFFAGAMSDAEGLCIDDFKDEDVFVVISPHDPKQMAVQIKQATALGKRICYDIGQQVTNISSVDIRAGISSCELLIVNDYEMGVVVDKTGWSQEEIMARIKTVVITLGERGSLVVHNNVKHHVKAAKISEVHDPTGAGDAFRAGFLYGYVRDVEPEICAQIGGTAAAFCIESMGTQQHFFTRDQFRERYRNSFGTLAILM